MQKFILSIDQVQELISKNRYRVDEKTKFLSRCIDGRYQNKVQSLKFKAQSDSSKLKVEEKQLPALAFPGGDVGELALILATANSYGFSVDEEKVYQILIKTIGGEKNFGIHSDHHADPKIPASGCGHWKQIQLDPTSYSLNKTNIEFIKKTLLRVLTTIVVKTGNQTILEGEHLEAAVLVVKGNWGILPRYKIETDSGSDQVEVFVYHQSLVDERHRALCSALLRQKAAKLFNGCDEEYLYQILSETAENHLMETARRLAKGLPIYEVKFDEDGSFEIKNVGNV